MQQLVDFLNYHTKLYNDGRPEISDKEWDEKYFQLIQMQHEAGYALEDSPTERIEYTILSRLKPIEHEHNMLSLQKSKLKEDIISFVGDKPCVAMSKMDGLTCSLTYENGRLIRAETRGDGFVGENILHNAKVVNSIPNTINHKGRLVIDGEIICTYKDFEKFAKDYKNPRNFAAGSIRLLSAKECSERSLTFVAWDVIEGSPTNFLFENLKWLFNFGFTVVPNVLVDNVEDAIDAILEQSAQLFYPIDGIVFKFNDISYAQSLGFTAHHPRGAMAFKTYDEEYTTTLRNIEWSVGRTGQICPIAVFDPVNTDESTIEKASLHNLTIMKNLLGTPYIGQKIHVFKANSIIPQILFAEKMDNPESSLLIPQSCPFCGNKITIEKLNDSEFLYCTNSQCNGKLINSLDYFVGKKGLDIKGLSKATLEKLEEWGWVKSRIDIFHLSQYKEEWKKKQGFGDKSVNNILDAIEKAKNTDFCSFLSSLGIPLIGQNVSKELIQYIPTYKELREKIRNNFDFSQYDGFGYSKSNALLTYDYSEADEIYKFLNVQENGAVEDEGVKTCNLKVVITGKLQIFKNRNEFKAAIERRGGKVVDNVNKSVDYLINNDIESTSSKNRQAKSLNIPVISEKDFIENFLTF